MSESDAIKIVVRHPDWVTCRSKRAGKTYCGALNVFDELYPVTCILCGRAM